ncbi:MAG: histidine phosphatase family protein [Candidatus Nealsonbacteria bacterium]|nr:histidine phosphatase family protein [Candidatus Nealsonbacteria bacterium]
MRLFIVRHGEISWSKIGFLSYTDLPLTKKGILQSKRVALELKNKNIEEIYTSNLRRCIQTAEELTKCLNLKIHIVPQLREVNFGIFEGLTLEEAEEKYPEIFKKRKRNKWNFSMPQGESYKDAEKRVMPLVKKLIKKNKNIVLVTHVTIIKIILKSLTVISLKKIEKYQYMPAEVVVLEIKNNKVELKKPILS